MSTRVTFRGLPALTVLVIGASALLAGTAAAHPPAGVHCGQTLTHSAQLRADLHNCPGDGVVIGADHITLDLNGHTIDGVESTGCDRPAVLTAGVHNPGHDGLTVKGGTVQQFDTGVAAGSATDGMSDGHVHGLVLRDDRFGGVALGSGAGVTATAGNQVDRNLVSGSPCGDGLKLNTGQANRFADNRVENSATGIDLCCGTANDANVVVDNVVAGTTGFGVLVFDSGQDRIAGNVLTDIGDAGIQVIGAGSATSLTDNTITRVRFAGIGVAACLDECGDVPAVPTGVRIVGNALAATGDGIFLSDTDGDLVRDNAITGAGTFGSGFGVGVLLNGVSSSLIRANTITDGGNDGPGPGILVGVPPDFGPSPRPVGGNRIARNTVIGQRADGILVASTAQDTTLARNTADRNGADGIHVVSRTTLLRRNSADDNAAFGIEAVAGVTDGGGNRAHGNGAAAQCSGVGCG
jgi:parallel beta-helix repeat protein